MTDRTLIAKLWTDALSAPNEANVAALSGALADDVVTVSPLGLTEGKDAVVSTFGQSPLAAFFARANWSEGVVDGPVVTSTCGFPAGAPVGGVTVQVTVDDEGRIARVETSIIPAPPPKPVPVKLSDAIAEAVNGALLNGTPFVVAYVDSSGRPHLSLRGSTQVYSADQLAIWVRNPEGGMLAAIPTNPSVTLLYRNPAVRTTYQFYGRAHVEDTPETRERVYGSAPEVERNLDPMQRGVPVVIDVDRVEGRDAGGVVLMERGAT